MKQITSKLIIDLFFLNLVSNLNKLLHDLGKTFSKFTLHISYAKSFPHLYIFALGKTN